MTDKQIIFNCDVNCIRKNTEECFELDCIKGQESILKQLKRKEQECEGLKKYKEVVDKLAGMQVILTNENGVPQLYDNAKDLKLKQLSKTLTEIKELCQKHIKAEKIVMANDILDKISEVENEK